jgi:hypothetical protein
MSCVADLLSLAGKWVGTYRLTVEPTERTRVSRSKASVVPVAGARFLRLDYDWEDKGQPQDGSLLVGYEKERGVVTAVWVDSWHMSNKVMVCEGEAGPGGSVEVEGSYAAPPGPDWGWRTVFGPGPDGTLRLLMYNVSPDEKEELAVEAVYARAE